MITDKRFEQTSYDTDSTKNISDTSMNLTNRKMVMDLMVQMHISEIEVSRTIVKYYFGQIGYHVITVFERDTM